MNPAIDWHALAPDVVLVATIVVVLLVDLLLPNRTAWQTSRIAAVGVLGALIPVLTPGPVTGRYPLYRLDAERVVSVNTTAAGGNTTLMTLG